MTIPTVFHNGYGEIILVTRAGRRLRNWLQEELRLYTYIYNYTYLACVFSDYLALTFRYGFLARSCFRFFRFFAFLLFIIFFLRF